MQPTPSPEEWGKMKKWMEVRKIAEKLKAKQGEDRSRSELVDAFLSAAKEAEKESRETRPVDGAGGGNVNGEIQDKAKAALQKVKSNVEKHVLPWWRKLCVRAVPIINAGKRKVVKGFCVCRDWTLANWQSERNGRIKVLAACGALLLVIGTVFSMAGSRPSTPDTKLPSQDENEPNEPIAVAHDSDGESKPDSEKRDASAEDKELAAIAALLEVAQDNQEMRGWLCSYKDCCAVYYSPTKPYGRMGGPCGHGTSHFWTEKGRAGSTIYRCHNCGLTMQMDETPWSGAECPRGGGHFWNRQY